MVDHLFVVNIRVNLHFIYGKCSENELKIFECFTSVPSSRGGFGGLSPPNKRPSPQIEIWNTINHWRFYQVFNINPPGISAKPPPHTHELKAPLVKTSWRRFCFTYSSHKFCPPSVKKLRELHMNLVMTFAVMLESNIESVLYFTK